MSVTEQYRIGGRSARELADSVERAIAAGDVAAGERLPSVRALAREAGVSPTTVSAAIGELRARGLVTTRARSRTCVSWRPPVAAPWAPATVEGVRDLATGNPDPALLPSLEPYLRRLELPDRLYGGEPAVPELVELARAELAGEGVHAEQLTVVSGALDGIERVLQASLRLGDVVAVEDPGYRALLHLLRALGLGLRPVAVDERGMRPDALAAALAEGVGAVVLTPRGQNPTGACVDAERAAELRDALSAAPDVLIVEDDHLGPVAGAEYRTVTGGRERWAVARSVSKSLGPDLRLALLAGDAQTIGRVQGRQLLGPQWVSHLLQRLAAAVWADPATGQVLKTAAETYRARRDAFTAALAGHGIEVAAPSGLNVWVPVADELAVVQALQAGGWAVAPGAPYRMRSAPAVRVTVGALDEGEAARVAAALAAALSPPWRTHPA